MSATISVTEAMLYTALRTFLMGLVSCPVMQSQQNRAAMPTGDFILMTGLNAPALSTDKVAFIPGSSNPGSETHSRSTQWNVQLDCYGTDAADMAALIGTAFKTDYAAQALAGAAIEIQPLYAENPRQMTILNAENQYEPRWIVELVFQYNPVVTLPQDFATALTVVPAEVDATFPP
ncbi:MAG: phage neck terminator protein [Rhodanobacteraceae bacterium]